MGEARQKANKVEHYLISIAAPGGHIHSYLMTENKSSAEKVLNRMYAELEKAGIEVRVPIALMTTLSTGVELVRKIIGEGWPEAKQAFETATNYHLTMFMTPAGSPEDEQLMELH
jgi:hypothetical protein